MNTTSHVLHRYSAAAQRPQVELCCPVVYDPELLRILPEEMISKDYGCGDPSRYVQEGDTVLDLGSGGGKICYMAAQLVGPSGSVIGVDMNDDMLALARRYQAEVAERIGGDRVRFVKGYIEDLALDVAKMEEHLARSPVRNAAELSALGEWQDQQRRDRPLIPDASVDLVISNCVLNLVDERRKGDLVREIFRVLKPGGRIAISDIVSDEPVPERLKEDTELWSGCVSGAFEEAELLQAFSDAGFLALRLDKWDADPWRIVDGIEFRSVTVTAVKGEGDSCLDVGHAVIYRGPYSEVIDDEGHIFTRGERMAVCERTFRFLTEGPLSGDYIGVTPRELSEPVAWCAPPGTRRSAAETKGAAHVGRDCGPGCC
ncbi:MAG: methyltransferase domain-containing protein [Gemmatimonadota bacterium]